MKLEIKHLAAYFPYRLFCNVTGNDDNIYNDCLLTVASTKDSYESFCFLYKDDMIAEVSMVHIEDIKPILRPLSDISKEIEHNGEKFIPYNKMCVNSKDIYATCLKNDNWASIDAIPHYDWGKLTEWHFDVFGLVEQGLAIDINTLQNER